MKITKTKLREMIEQELKEISGTLGTGVDIEKLRKRAGELKSKLGTKRTKQNVEK